MAFTLIPDLAKDDKNSFVQKKIIRYSLTHAAATIPELSRELNLSVPTITKFITEMSASGIITEHGKRGPKAGGGRRPNSYGLNPDSGYFLGVDLADGYINVGLSNFNGEMVQGPAIYNYTQAYSSQAAFEEICRLVMSFLAECGMPQDRVLNACFNISGRVNPKLGYSYSCFNLSEVPLSERLSGALGMGVCIENDTRAMAFGELLRGAGQGARNMLFVNLSWGLGLGIIIDGNIYRGNSGFAGEIGHVSAYDNEQLCHCGKKGCLETEVSGRALMRHVREELARGKNSLLLQRSEGSDDEVDIADITLDDIMDAIAHEDMLCIDALDTMGSELGKHLAGMINIFNPEKVVIGGKLAATEDYLLPSVKQAVRRYSLNLVNRDTRIMCSHLGSQAGVTGACMLARANLLLEDRE